MYDTGKIIVGLIIFLCLITLPIWYNTVSGKSVYMPELEIVTDEEHCIESTQYMREEHIDLLLEWRETVVREGTRTYIANDGQEYEMSLTGTCLRCHWNRTEFCDQCHNYMGVKPNCWNCHNIPTGKSE